jgi:hypothetical protein
MLGAIAGQSHRGDQTWCRRQRAEIARPIGIGVAPVYRVLANVKIERLAIGAASVGLNGLLTIIAYTCRQRTYRSDRDWFEAAFRSAAFARV